MVDDTPDGQLSSFEDQRVHLRVRIHFWVTKS